MIFQVQSWFSQILQIPSKRKGSLLFSPRGIAIRRCNVVVDSLPLLRQVLDFLLRIHSRAKPSWNRTDSSELSQTQNFLTTEEIFCDARAESAKRSFGLIYSRRNDTLIARMPLHTRIQKGSAVFPPHLPSFVSLFAFHFLQVSLVTQRRLNYRTISHANLTGF